MKIHIVSLQRTGSKNLYNAICDKLPNRLRFDNGDELGEILHLWSMHGYKFGPSAKKPFDKDAQVWFRTHPDFDSETTINSVNFIPLFSPSAPPRWFDMNYTKQFPLKYSLTVQKHLTDYDGDVVIKTQLADIEEYSDDQRQQVLNDWDFIVTLVPLNVARWICSNYLCDLSGIFVPIKEQQQAGSYYVANPVTIPESYIQDKLAVYVRHRNMIETFKKGFKKTSGGYERSNRNKIISLYTEGLSVEAGILHQLGLGSINVPKVSEFSNNSYPEMIKNFDQVVELCQPYMGK